MQQTLTTRIAFLTTISASFGFVIIKLVEVKNASFAISGVALLLALIASLVISLFLLARLTARRRQYFTMAAVVLFLGAVASFYLFQKNFIDSTVIVPEFNKDGTIEQKYFKGSKYTADARKMVALSPELKEDDNALLNLFENRYEAVWIPNSVRDTELNLAMWYILFVIMVVSSLSLATEILTKEELKTKRAAPAAAPKATAVPAGATEKAL